MPRNCRPFPLALGVALAPRLALAADAAPGGEAGSELTFALIAAALGVVLVGVAVLRARNDRFQAILAGSFGTLLLLIPLLIMTLLQRPAVKQEATLLPVPATVPPPVPGHASPGAVPLQGLLTAADPGEAGLIPPGATALGDAAQPPFLPPQATSSSPLAANQSSARPDQPADLPPFNANLPEPVLRLPAQAMLASQLELYPQLPAGGVLAASRYPLSTFPIHLGAASYLDMRRFLAEGILPPTGIVRVEEFLNYFTYSYPQPKPGEGLRIVSALYPAPWNERAQILQIALVAEAPAATHRPALLIVLSDTSGSMGATGRLPMLKQALKRFAGELAPTDRMALLSYAGDQNLQLAPTANDEDGALAAGIDSLRAGGVDRAQTGLRMAWRMAEDAQGDGMAVRIVLATDGDINLGTDSLPELAGQIRAQSEQGVGFSVLNLGGGEPSDPAMETLARAGDGSSYAVDTPSELLHALREELQHAAGPRIGDLSVSVRFNPAGVSYYRLIGYETRSMEAANGPGPMRENSSLAPGDQITALYEIRCSDRSRGNAPQSLIPNAGAPSAGTADGSGIFTAPGALALISVSGNRLSDKTKVSAEDVVTSADFQENLQSLPADYRLAAAVAGFGQLLRAEPAVAGLSLEHLRRLAADATDNDPDGRRGEFLALLERAKRARPLGVATSDTRP